MTRNARSRAKSTKPTKTGDVFNRSAARTFTPIGGNVLSTEMSAADAKLLEASELVAKLSEMQAEWIENFGDPSPHAPPSDPPPVKPPSTSAPSDNVPAAPLESALRTLAHVSEALHIKVGKLEEQLAPLMRPNLGGCCSEARKDAVPSSSVVSRIEDMATTISLAIDRIEVLRGSLEV